MLKNVIYTIKNAIIETDVGIIIEEVKDKEVYQLESVINDTGVHATRNDGLENLITKAC
jgi:hypothetical protein